MAYLLAIDAGGTKTEYLLADERQTLARVRGGTIKRMRADAETCVANLETALSALTQQSGVQMSEIACSCIGTAGNTVPLVADWLRTEIPSRVAGKLLLLGDVEIALDAAFRGGPGVLVLAGTGSNVAGRTRAGVISTVGGWGPVLADQASGHRIGQEALRAIFFARDEGRTTALLDAVMHFWKLSSIDRLVEYANCSPHPDFSQLTPLVVDCASRGDEVARRVLQQQGQELGRLVRLLIRRLRGLSADASFLPALAFAGSIMAHVPLVREALLAHVRDEFPDVPAQEGIVDPIEGALWRARQAIS
jgi:N-acetylglucosamine kinase-like BadF-type ATPase